MATAHVQSKGAITNSATALGVTLTSSVGAGNHLMAAMIVYCPTGDPVIGAPTSSPSNTWQNALAEQHVVLATDWEAWRAGYAENVASGSTTVTVHCTNTSD